MSQGWAKSTWEITNYGRFINQFSPNIKRSIRQFETINKKICRQKMSIMFNQICINEEMLPQYTYVLLCIHIHMYIYILLSSNSFVVSHTHTHTHTHIYIYIYIYIERERESSKHVKILFQATNSFI